MNVVSDVQKKQLSSSTADYDVVVVGAGPYGLATAAHLLGKGLKVAVFGKTLELWRQHMPKGMHLRSHWWATSLSDPKGQYSFEKFFKLKGYQQCHPLPADIFIEYALWFQKNAVPNVDETYVSTIERQDGRFILTLEDGRVVRSQQVVMAIGLYYYANRPAEYQGFPSELVSHSFEHDDFSRFAGKNVLVIGAGQSAVEYTALLMEAGATVHLVSRKPIKWLEPDYSEKRTLVEKIKAPAAGIAPGWKNWALEHLPYKFYTYPQERKDNYLRNNYQAAASDWLVERVQGKANLHEGQKVTQMVVNDNAIDATLSDGTVLHVDHVMSATGYEVNLNRLSMLHPSLAAQIQTDKNIPILSHYFESSVLGMYFVGLSSIRAFGPLYRFVVGNTATAKRVAHAVAQKVTQTR